jgi:hypothetical protein
MVNKLLTARQLAIIFGGMPIISFSHC